MKKIFFIFIVLLSSITLTKAQDSNLGDIMDNLAGQVMFGYSTTQNITVQNIANDKIIIQSPLIKNEIGSSITKYTIMYSEYPLSQILEQTELLDQTMEKTVDIIPSGDTFTIELGINDNIDMNKTYYLFIIPKDNNGSLGEVSNEIRFKLADKSYGEGIANTTSTIQEVHNAPGADMTLANIYHTQNGNTINIGRTSVDGSDMVTISLWNETSQSFDNLTTTAMSNEKFQFTTTRNGTHTIKLTPNNNGREATYTFEVSGINQPANTITKVPKTGPKETAILIAISTFVIYFRYRRIQKRH